MFLVLVLLATLEQEKKYVFSLKSSLVKCAACIPTLFFFTCRKKTELDMVEWTEKGIVAEDLSSGKIYSKIDFKDLEHVDAYKSNSDSGVTLNLIMKDKISHTFPPVDRCCRSDGKGLRFDGIDNMVRIHCNVSSNFFQNEYVNKRKLVILTGCQEGWKSRKWTFGNLLGRYISKWPVSYYHNEKEDCYSGNLSGPQIYQLMKNKTFFKSFVQLPRSKLADLDDSEMEYYKLDLLDEYALPTPFPRDESEKINVPNDQNYVMLSSAETGRISIFERELLSHGSSTLIHTPPGEDLNPKKCTVDATFGK